MVPKLLNNIVPSSPRLRRHVLFKLMNDGGWAVSPYTRVYSLLLCKLRKDIELVGKSRLYSHPSTKLNMQASRIIVENGTLRLGISRLDFPAEYDATMDNCRFYLNASAIHAKGDVTFYPGVKIVALGGMLVVGSGTVILAPSYIFVRKLVEIGRRCLISRCVTIMDSDWHKLSIGNDEPREQIKEVIIKDHCWIGQHVTILKGVTVGEGAVVGANSSVTVDVEPRTMVVGNPARVIKEKVTWER